MTCCLQMLDLQQRLYQAEQASASHVANAEQLQQVSGHCLSGCMFEELSCICHGSVCGLKRMTQPPEHACTMPPVRPPQHILPAQGAHFELLTGDRPPQGVLDVQPTK